jgi:NIPSNAP
MTTMKWRRPPLARVAGKAEDFFMVYELRIYQCVPGRLPVLLKRFEDHTLKIWEKHGIRQAGFWTVLIGDGNNDLHYLLAWESLAEREKVWGAFLADPAWIKVREETEKDGPIIANIRSSLLKPTAFSAVK